MGMYIPPIHPLSHGLNFFEQKRISKLDRLKSVCGFADLKTVDNVDRILENRKALSSEKTAAFAQLLNHFMQSKEVTEKQLLCVFDYLSEHFPGHEMNSDLRGRLVSCIFLYCLRHYKEQLDCVIYEEAIQNFATLLRIENHRALWEEGITHAIQHTKSVYNFNFEYLLLLLQISSDLIFHARKENRDIWDEGPKRLVRDGIEKRLCFQIAKILADDAIALAFVQVFISKHPTMVYNESEIDFLLKLMTDCKCSIDSIINMKRLTFVGMNPRCPAAYHYLYASLKALGNTHFASLSDIENQFAFIHQEFHHLEINHDSRIKLLEGINGVITRASCHNSPFDEEQIDTIYREFTTLFKINSDWMHEAKAVCLNYYQRILRSHTKDFDYLIHYIKLTARTLLGQEEFNQAKIDFYSSCLCVKLALEISGAHLKPTHQHDAFDSTLIIRLVEESLCHLESYPDQLHSLKLIIRNPRLSSLGCISILEMLIVAKKPIAQELFVIVLEKFLDPFHGIKQPRIALSLYIRLLKMFVDESLLFNKPGFGKAHRALIIKFLGTKWNFDTVYHAFDTRRMNGFSRDRIPLCEHYLGEVQQLLIRFGEQYGVLNKVDSAEMCSIWMDSLVDKILELRQMKIPQRRHRGIRLLSLKRELLNLLYDYCRLIETLREELKAEMKRNKDNYYRNLFERPQQFLSRLEGFRLYLPTVDEPIVNLVNDEFVLVDRGEAYSLLILTNKDDL